jgi:hypothetical protein
MSQEEFAGLVADIQQHGLHEPITLYDGQIIDGRNRYRACRQLGITPTIEHWNGPSTPEAYVISKNLHRRHLNESQRAMIEAGLVTMKRGNANSQRRADVNRSTSPLSASEAARLLSVSRVSVQHAKTVQHKGTAEEIAAAEAGRVTSLRDLAHDIKTGTPPEQRQPRCVAPATAGKKRQRRGFGQQQSNAAIWRHLRDGLINFNSLPLPADVARIVGHPDMADLIDAHLPGVRQWLDEFAHEWKMRSVAPQVGSAAAHSETSPTDDLRPRPAAAAGNGSRAART